MQTQNRLLDDVARLFSGAVGMASGMRGEVEAQFRQQFEKILSQMDLVTREEYEVTRDMVAKAREEQEQLLERVAKLEEALAAAQKKPAAKRAAKPRAKATASKSAATKSTAAKSTRAKAAGSKSTASKATDDKVKADPS
ncbi:accessory factor UbiK family protein [Rhodovibrionaceae bacterium A322]